VESLSIPDEQPSSSSLLHSTASAQTGRPSIYNDELADRIVEALFDGHGLRAISRMPGMPSAMTITRWRHSNPGFRSLYEEARKLQLELMADDIIEIADGAGQNVPLGRLRTETRKWILSKLVRHVYGTTALVEQVAEEASDIDYTKLTDDELNTMLVLLEKANRANDAA
jgi:hypothetical protein